MTARLVDKEWGSELTDALLADNNALRIICPFIKAGALDRLLSCEPGRVMVITRFNLADFAEGVSDVAALRKLLDCGARVRGIRNLHAKLYLFGESRAIITSANLTKAALDRNHEFGLVAEDPTIVATCLEYFQNLWQRGGEDLSEIQVDDWDKVVSRYRATGGRPSERAGLGDFGADASVALPVRLPVSMSDASRAFVKFLGNSKNRVPLIHSTLKEIDETGCHWAVSYPASRRPRQVQDDDVIFIGRLTRDPNDIRIFGRAIGMKHVEGRDDATPEDVLRRPWKEKWSRYIRVYRAEFVAGTMSNGVSLNGLMDVLRVNSFRSTQRNMVQDQGGNTDPRKAYLQKPAVELSREGMEWLSDQLQEAFDTHGKVPQAEIDSLDWPDLPPARA